MHIDFDIVDDIVVHLGSLSSRCLVRLGVMRLILYCSNVDWYLDSLMATRSRGCQAKQRTNSLTPLVSNGGGIHFSRANLEYWRMVTSLSRFPDCSMFSARLWISATLPIQRRLEWGWDTPTPLMQQLQRYDIIYSIASDTLPEVSSKTLTPVISCVT